MHGVHCRAEEATQCKRTTPPEWSFRSWPKKTGSFRSSRTLTMDHKKIQGAQKFSPCLVGQGKKRLPQRVTWAVFRLAFIFNFNFSSFLGLVKILPALKSFKNVKLQLYSPNFSSRSMASPELYSISFAPLEFYGSNLRPLSCNGAFCLSTVNVQKILLSQWNFDHSKILIACSLNCDVVLI